VCPDRKVSTMESEPVRAVTPPVETLAAAPSGRECILRAAARLYAIQGFEGTSMRDIAEAAGVTKPLIFYHFESKERLYASLLNEALAACKMGGREILGSPSLTATEKLKLFLASHVAVLRDRPEVFAFAHDLLTLSRDQPLGFDYRTEGRELFAQITRVIEEGQASGEFRQADPAAIAILPVAALGMYADALLIGEIQMLPAGLEDLLLDLLLHGIEEHSE